MSTVRRMIVGDFIVKSYVVWVEILNLRNLPITNNYIDSPLLVLLLCRQAAHKVINKPLHLSRWHFIVRLARGKTEPIIRQVM